MPWRTAHNPHREDVSRTVLPGVPRPLGYRAPPTPRTHLFRRRRSTALATLRTRATAAVLALTSLCVASPALAAKPRVTVIGDSVAASLLYVKSAVAQLKKGLDVRLDLRVCRRLAQPSCPYQGAAPPSALESIQAAGPALGTIVVIKVGYNETSATYRKGLEQVMTALRAAGVESVVWVTLAERTPDYAATNRIIRAAVARHPEMCVADWAAASRGKPAYFGADGLHLSATGAFALARLVKPFAVRAAKTGSCLPATA